MMRLTRRKGPLTVIAMTVVIGVAGCLNNADEHPFLQTNANGTVTLPRNTTFSSRTGEPPLYTSTGLTPANVVNSAPDGNILRAQFTPPAGNPNDPNGDPNAPTLPMPTPMHGPPGVMAAGSPPLPTELARVSHPPHRVAPPDILYLEAVRLVPKGPYKLSAMEVLQLEVTGTLPNKDVKGLYMISPDGRINLGHSYGSVLIGNLTIDQALAAIRNHLREQVKDPNVNMALVQTRGMQNIKGEHLVRPDGTISLGMYGAVYVAGMTLGQVKAVIENHLAAYLVDPQISVDVFAYNSRKIYIIADGAGYGQQVIALPATGGETVLDAISRVQGLPQVASLKKIWVARPSPAGHPCSQVLPIDWKAITQAGRTETNYELFPGDRIYISSNPLIATYNYLDMMLAPVERVLGVLFLGSSTVNSFRGTGNSGVIVAK
jgi:protein involved in polysaccharide export with SLBB domain